MTELNLIQDSQESIQLGIEKVGKKLIQYNNMNTGDKKRAIKQIEREIRRLDNSIGQFLYNITTNLPKELENDYKEIYNQINNNLSELKLSLHNKKNEFQEGGLFSKKKPQPAIELSNLTTDETVQLGYDTQDKSKDAALRIKKRVQETNVVADEISEELVAHEETFLRLDETMNRMDGTLVRVGKYLKYFKKTMMTDKLLICLTFTILILIVCVLIMYFVNKNNDEAQENEEQASEDTVKLQIGIGRMLRKLS